MGRSRVGVSVLASAWGSMRGTGLKDRGLHLVRIYMSMSMSISEEM